MYPITVRYGTPQIRNKTMDYYSQLELEVVEGNNPPQLVSAANIKTLGCPFGFTRYGDRLKARGVRIQITDPNHIGKGRVKFTLPCDITVANEATAVTIKKGKYDFLVDASGKQDWSGWFND